MVLRKFVNPSSNFPLEEIRHAVVTHQNLIENDPQNIATHRIWQSTIRHTYRHSPYFGQATKVKSPPTNPPSFQNNFLISIFFQIDDFRSDRSFPQEIRQHVLRDTINFATRDLFRSNKRQSVLQTILMIPKISSEHT